jgi:dihydroneopterin aldolase/2-amino-4-hydroxy-6-hydroxymethyldihydropteridine diphosphokinase
VLGISGTGHHGVFDHERREGQTFVVDVTLAVDTRAAAATDDLERTVNYAEVAAAVLAVIEGPAYDLVETVAQKVADAILGFDGVEAVEVVVHKPEAPVGVPFRDVVVTIVRQR